MENTTKTIEEAKSGKRIAIDFGNGVLVSVMVFPDEEVGAFLVLNGMFVGEIRGGDA